MPLDRRRFVLGAMAAGVTVAGCRNGNDGDDGSRPTGPDATDGAAAPATMPPIDPGPTVGEAPFTLGVASGDPAADAVVLWTAVDRAESRPVAVELALDEAMTTIVRRGSATAEPDAAMTVHVSVGGLSPDTVYWYRFLVDGHHSPVGRTRTAPVAGALPAEALTIGQLSCMRRSDGYWTALDDLAATAPDLVVHCGDYVYESDGGSVRPDDTLPPTSLEEYRDLWRRYKADPSLQAAHAVAPWLMTWDDHEVENNYQGEVPNGADSGDNAFDAQKVAAYRAWWEFTPTAIPPPSPVTTSDVGLHRAIDWGALTRFVLLDTRQYRDDQPCPGELASDVGPRCAASDSVSMLGGAQESWFTNAVDHDAAWTTVVNQTVLHQWRFLPGNALWNLDQWDGYPAARRRLLDALADAPDPVVLSGDVHSSWTADLWRDFDVAADDADPVGVEFVGPSVSSRLASTMQTATRLLPVTLEYIDWAETTKRGWVLHTVSEDRWEAEYRLVDDVTVPDAPVHPVRAVTVDRGDRRIGASEALDAS